MHLFDACRIFPNIDATLTSSRFFVLIDILYAVVYMVFLRRDRHGRLQIDYKPMAL